MTIESSAKPVPRRIAVLGAGLAGATAAHALQQAGVAVEVYDKARGPGGRAATRRTEHGAFDHGAQYFVARDPRFQDQVKTWAAAGMVRRWIPRLYVADADGLRPCASDDPRWVALPGMSALVKPALQGIAAHYGRRVCAAQYGADGWQLSFEDGAAAGPFAALVSTLPAPQALELFAAESQAETLRSVAFRPCWALMVAFAEPLPTPCDAAFVNAGPLSWIARNNSKPGREDGECWVVHAGVDYSTWMLEFPAETVVAELLPQLFAALQIEPVKALVCSAHRWRYALAEPALEQGALWNPARALAIGGDWCHGSRIEGAYLSGLALAASVLQSG